MLISNSKECFRQLKLPSMIRDIMPVRNDWCKGGKNLAEFARFFLYDINTPLVTMQREK